MFKALKKLTGKGGVPLIVDFDGTLQRSDVLWETVAWCLRHDWPLLAAMAFAYLLKGRAAAKLLAEGKLRGRWVPVFPWDTRVVELAKAAEKDGREVLVYTGSAEMTVAEAMRAKGLKWEVVGTSDPAVNLTSGRKTAALVKRFGEKGYDYVGNSRADLKVWKGARKAIVVNASPALERAAEAQGNVTLVLPREGGMLKALLKGMRLHQWLKNLLVFVPLLAAHAWMDAADWARAGAAFVAFGFCASGVYLLNDLMDLADDRNHPRKRNRPLAAGTLPVPLALLMVVALKLAAFGLAGAVGVPLVAVLVAYIAVTMAYSVALKQWPVWDVVVLAGLYCMRLVAGSAATGIVLSFWLMLLALLGFYSLALLKRYIELSELAKAKTGKTMARGYHLDDAGLLAAQGMASGVMAVTVVALYLQSPAVMALYRHPLWVGLICPLALWWLGRVWLMAHRGEVHDDPVVFAARDPASWACAAIAVAIVVLAS